jgi:hypothetical protein
MLSIHFRCNEEEDGAQAFPFLQKLKLDLTGKYQKVP